MIINGLLFGLISTLHCAGMCGPLALSVPARASSNKLLFSAVYHSGRIGIYVLIGLLVYSVGYSFSLFRMQQILSIVLGILMVLFVLWQYAGLPLPAIAGGISRKLTGRLGSLSVKGKTPQAFVLGIINGLLPCGAIYIAAVYCAALEGPLDAAAYMVLFGIGTLPVFISAWFFLSDNLLLRLRKFRKVYRLLPLTVGVFMILRGAGLGIPYLSPDVQEMNGKAAVKDCCKHK